MESLLYKNPTANPVDIIQAGGAQFLLNMSNTTKGNGNMSAFLPEEDQITEEYVNIVSAAWENLSEEEKNNQGNSYLKQLYDQTYNHIVSQSSDPELFKAYARQMGMVDDAGWDSDHQMTLEEFEKVMNI